MIAWLDEFNYGITNKFRSISKNIDRTICVHLYKKSLFSSLLLKIFRRQSRIQKSCLREILTQSTRKMESCKGNARFLFNPIANHWTNKSVETVVLSVDRSSQYEKKKRKKKKEERQRDNVAIVIVRKYCNKSRVKSIVELRNYMPPHKVMPWAEAKRYFIVSLCHTSFLATVKPTRFSYRHSHAFVWMKVMGCAYMWTRFVDSRTIAT